MRCTIMVLVTLLAGCIKSPVRELGDNTYTVTAQNLMSWSTGTHEMYRALDEAKIYCAGRGKVPLMKSHAENGVTVFTPIDSTIVFQCVDATDPAYAAQVKALGE